MNSYDLPHRIHVAKVYTLTAPDGSTVIVYGHENGIRAVWKRACQSREKQEVVEPFYASVVHTVDVSLGGAEALHIAFPQVPTDMNQDTKSIPKLLSERIVVAVACSDCNIRVVSLPLLPPKSQDAADQVILLSGEPSHQSLPDCVSVTFTPRPSLEGADVDTNNADHTLKQITSRPVSRSSRRSSGQADMNWDLLVASHSPSLSGQLIIHRIPCNKSSLEDSTMFGAPWSVHRLASPAVSVSFSSALHPSPYHSRLLIAEAQGVVRIMKYTPKVAEGPWLASLYTDFESPSETEPPKRKSILDSRWLLGGKAIIVLLSNGEWGIWDTNNAGPQAAERALQTQNFKITSRFAVDGWVHVKAAKTTTSSMDTKSTTSKLAPMTPSTRKARQAVLFAPKRQQQQSSMRGGISVISSSNILNSRADDESVLLWHGTNIVTIPSFFTYWQNRVRGSGHLFGTGFKGEMKTINDVQLSGEALNEVSLDPGSTQLEIVAAAQRRLLIIAPPYSQKRRAPVNPHLESNLISTDEQLLAAGELDTFGMDRVLDNMSNGYGVGDDKVARKLKTIKTH